MYDRLAQKVPSSTLVQLLQPKVTYSKGSGPHIPVIPDPSSEPRECVDNPGTVSGRRSLALPTEVPRSCDRYRMTCQRTRTPLAQALLHQEIPGLRSRRRHSCTDHSVAHVCASAIVPRSYRVSHMLGSGSPHPVLTPTPPVIPAGSKPTLIRRR